jgi:hypothetical protein
VLSLRIPLAWHHGLALAVHGVAMRAVEGWYRDEGRARGIRNGKTGSITVIQRFGSDLALNVARVGAEPRKKHSHVLALDGVFDAHGAFTSIAAPTLDDMQTITTRIASMCDRRAITDDVDDSERALLRAFARSASPAAASKHAPEATEDPDHDAPDWGGLLKAHADGYDLECTTVIREGDRDRLEHLCKYLLRPPLADRRLRLRLLGAPNGGDRVAMELKTPSRDGTNG